MELEEAFALAREIDAFGAPIMLDGVFKDDKNGGFVVELFDANRGEMSRLHWAQEWPQKKKWLEKLHRKYWQRPPGAQAQAQAGATGNGAEAEPEGEPEGEEQT